MKDKHTPGPWAVVGEGTIKSGDLSIGEAYIYDENDYDYNPKSDDVRKKLPWMANARLMAASPKMYEFIEKLATTLIPTGVAHSFASTSILHAIVDSAKNLTKEIEGDE